MAKRERSNPEWQALITEHQMLKRKLQSKSEALLIISKDLEKVQNERDQFKIMAEKLQERCQAYKRQHADFLLTGDKAKLVHMLQDMKKQKAAYQQQNEILHQKLNEATGDVKLLREKFARRTIGDEGIGARHFPLHAREKLVSQLEEAQQQSEHWRREFESQVEVANEAITDRDGSREKAERLNAELSRVLSGDKNRIVDIDALCMENKYLQERVAQCLAEKNTLHTQINKYKNLLSSKRTSRSDLQRAGALRTSDIVVSPKHLKDLLSKGGSSNSAEKLSDLQSIVSTLLETLNDKNLALHHLRNTNKILGNRLSELEQKLKTFEVAGLWNVQATSSSLNGHGDSKDFLQSHSAPSRRPIDSDDTPSCSDDDQLSTSSDSPEPKKENLASDVTTDNKRASIDRSFISEAKNLESGDSTEAFSESSPLKVIADTKVSDWLNSSSSPTSEQETENLLKDDALSIDLFVDGAAEELQGTSELSIS